MSHTIRIICVLIVLAASIMLVIQPTQAEPSLPTVLEGYTISLFASGLDGPVDVVFDKSGNLYVANEGLPGISYPGTTISVIDKKGNIETYASGFEGPSGLAFNSYGELYVSDDTCWVYKVEGGTGTPFVQIVNNPNSIAFDANDNLYVAPHGGPFVWKVTPDGDAVAFAGPFVHPHGLAFDNINGNLYVSDAGTDIIWKIAPDGTMTQFASDIVQTEGLAFDSVGLFTPPPPPPAPTASVEPRPWRNLFAVGAVAGTIYQINESGEKTVFASGFQYPRRITFAANGDLYVSEFGHSPNYVNKIWKISRSGR